MDIAIDRIVLASLSRGRLTPMDLRVIPVLLVNAPRPARSLAVAVAAGAKIRLGVRVVVVVGVRGGAVVAARADGAVGRRAAGEACRAAAAEGGASLAAEDVIEVVGRGGAWGAGGLGETAVDARNVLLAWEAGEK